MLGAGATKRLYPELFLTKSFSKNFFQAYWNVYKDRPIWETSWKRNLRTQLKWQPPTRLFCIDRNGRFNVNNACPVCRDEYFFFDYRVFFNL